MTSKNKTNNDFNDLPEPDENFLSDFEQNLWKILKEAESIALTEAFAEKEPLQNAVDEMSDCLTFARCREMGNHGEKPTPKEEKHLSACSYCFSRLKKFRELTPELFISEPKSRFWTRVKDKLRLIDRGIRRPVFVSAGLIILLLTGLSFFVISHKIPADEQVRVDYPVSFPSPIPQIEQANEDLPPSKTAAANIGSSLPKTVNRGNSSRISSNGNSVKKKKGDNGLPKALKSDFGLIDELSKVSAADREAVVAAFRADDIPLSDDLKLFKTKPNLRRKVAEKKMTQPISPVNYAVTESSPVLSWQRVENVRYVITIMDRQMNEIVRSGELNQNSWRVSKNLTSGIYFWKVSIVAADGTEISSNAPLPIFKIITGNEKDSLEKTIRRVKSKIVRGVIYFRAGLLDEAERQAKEELKENPDSRPAGNLLRAMRNFKKQNIKK